MTFSNIYIYRCSEDIKNIAFSAYVRNIYLLVLFIKFASRVITHK